MKRKFILVPDAGQMTEKSVVAVVWVGSSRREGKMYRELKAIADANGWWFELWAEHVDQRLWYENARVFHTDGYFVINFKKACFGLQDALNFVKSKELIPNITNRPVTKSRMILLSLFHPQCVSIQNRIHAISHLHTLSRKYLSDSERTDRYNAAVAFGLISILFFLGMVLESVERWLLG